MLNGDGFVNRVHIARYLTDKGITDSVSNAFKTVINTKSKYFVKRREMTFEDGLYAVVQCGGLPSIAHFVEYRFTDEEIDEIATITADATDTVGVELWHYKQNADFRRQIIDRCKNIIILILSLRQALIFTEKTRCKISVRFHLTN